MNLPIEERMRRFEDAFKKACIEYKIDAAFVLVKGVDEKGSILMIGGAKHISDFIERSLLPHTVEAKEKRH